MFSSIGCFKAFLVSLLLGVPSSALLFLAFVWFQMLHYGRSLPTYGLYLGVLELGFFKSLLVGAIALEAAPPSRWRRIVISTAVLTLLEELVYVALSTFSLPD